jgi:hypothetical protein
MENMFLATKHIVTEDSSIGDWKEYLIEVIQALAYDTFGDDSTVFECRTFDGKTLKCEIEVRGRKKVFTFGKISCKVSSKEGKLFIGLSSILSSDGQKDFGPVSSSIKIEAANNSKQISRVRPYIARFFRENMLQLQNLHCISIVESEG